MFRVLEVDDPEWTARLAALPPQRRDVHFGPRILAAYTAAFGWRACLGLTEKDDAFIIQPILITDKNHMRHAYNFGGPVGNIGSDTLASRHGAGLVEWAEKAGVVSEYCTLNPFLIDHQRVLMADADVHYSKDVVYIDLTKPFQLRGTTRRLANKALGAGVKIYPVGVPCIPQFHEMYSFTMERRKAAEHWRLPIAFFHALYRLAKAIILFAYVDDKPESCCMILNDYAGPAYYHFQGSYNHYPELGANHALVLAAAELARSWGSPKLHLGGGVTTEANDSLLMFKAGFSPLRAPVYYYEDVAQKTPQAA